MNRSNIPIWRARLRSLPAASEAELAAMSARFPASEWLKLPGDVAPLALFLAGLPNHGPSGQSFSLMGRDP